MLPASEEFPVLAQEKGLSRCRNDTVKYLSFLNALLNDETYEVSSLSSLIQTSVPEAIHRCHTIQGVAATLGALEYHRALAAMERLLENDPQSESVTKVLALIEASRDRLLQAISTLQAQ